MTETISREMAKHWWLECVACSEAAMTTQMRGFGLEEPVYEQATHPLSGGFMHLGHACGLLTGAALAAGFVAKAHLADPETRATATLYTTIQLAQAYPEWAGAVDCREITELSFAKLSDRLRYLQQGKGRMCGRLHLKWAPQAQQVIEQSLARFEADRPAGRCANCAVKAMQKMAASTGMAAEEATLVAGLAGGIGLLGNVCGVLAAGIYALSIAQYRKQAAPKRDSRLRGSLQELAGADSRGSVSRLRRAFSDRFAGELCSQIARRRFQSIEDHAAFVEQGGCREVIDFVAAWVEDRAAG